jgi:hypothetical protein
LLPQLWQRFWKRWDKHSSLDFFDYLMYKWSMFQKLAPSSVTWSNRWDWFSKESTRVGVFADPHHLRTKQGPSSKMSCFFCTLDDGESSKQEYAWMLQTIIKTSQNSTVYFMCAHNKWSCLAISGHLNHTSLFLHNEFITGDYLHSCRSKSHVEVGQCLILLDDQVIQIFFQPVQKPYGKNFCARVTPNGVPKEIKWSWIVSFVIAEKTFCFDKSLSRSRVVQGFAVLQTQISCLFILSSM